MLERYGTTWISKKHWRQLRRGHGIPPGKKVLIVLDQFEQWLHGNRRERHTELVQALRQCDGGTGPVRRDGAG